jgi:hypothetical protein
MRLAALGLDDTFHALNKGWVARLPLQPEERTDAQRTGPVMRAADGVHDQGSTRPRRIA